MNFNPNKTPIEIIKEGAFGGTYFRDIYSNNNERLNNSIKYDRWVLEIKIKIKV